MSIVDWVKVLESFENFDFSMVSVIFRIFRPAGLRGPAGRLGGLPRMGPQPLRAGGLSELSPSSVGVGRTDGYQDVSPGGVYVDW